MSTHKVAVYGSLQTPFHNHDYLRSSTLLGEDTLKLQAVMYDMGSFPCIVESEGVLNSIEAEVYEVTGKVLQSLDVLEGHPYFYERRTITTSFGEAWCYFLNEKVDKPLWPVVKYGDWQTYMNKSKKVG